MKGNENMVKRERYIERIRPFYESELIKVLIGIRRCGKSVLLRQIIGEIKEKRSEERRRERVCQYV